MALILITGTSTSGKSTIAHELGELGYNSIDIEHSGSAAYYSKQTGIRAAEFGQAPERTKEWLNNHEWLIDVDWVKDLHKQAIDADIYICGGSENESIIAKLCDKVIWLKTDEKTIKSRVNNPRDHDYGTRLHELEKIIEDNKRKEAEFQSQGAITIDVMRPLPDVLDDILKLTSTS
jgi:broad-specificity NMP kinase